MLRDNEDIRNPVEERALARVERMTIHHLQTCAIWMISEKNELVNWILARYLNDWPQRRVVLMQSSVRATGSFLQPSAIERMKN